MNEYIQRNMSLTGRSGNDKAKSEDASTEHRHIGDDDKPETVASIQQSRRRQLSDGCREFAHVVNRSNQAWFEMYYDDQLDYVYCLISKASCTSWKRTLMMLTGKITEFQRPEQLPADMVHDGRNKDKYVARIQTLPEAHRAWRFDSYFTFLFVREPLERLVSAYRDKVLENPGYLVDTDIVRKYRPREYRASVKRYNVTFAEFVRYVLDERAAGRVLDRHWIPQNELCRVCQYRYDFIGHHETLLRDARYVVAALKSRIPDVEQRKRVDNVTFPVDSGHRKSSEFLQRMYAGVPAARVQALYQLYAVDYALFGFEHPNVTGFRPT